MALGRRDLLLAGIAAFVVADFAFAAQPQGETCETGDFGTGYSSLSYLSRFPVDTLKIDRSFVGRLEGDLESAAIISATVDLARNLGLKVIAEGVETATQPDLLSRLGCDFAHGLYLSMPLPPDGVQGWIETPPGPP